VEISVINFFYNASMTSEQKIDIFVARGLPDADDTAKSLISLLALKRAAHATDQLVAHFWKGDGFRTYGLERNSSLSANCNALKALLDLPITLEHTNCIKHTANYICEIWEKGQVSDKWVCRRPRPANTRYTNTDRWIESVVRVLDNALDVGTCEVAPEIQKWWISRYAEGSNS
jgi:hypothetical protein